MTNEEFQQQAQRVERGKKLMSEIESLRERIVTVRDTQAFALASAPNRHYAEAGYGRIDFSNICSLTVPACVIKELVEYNRSRIIEVYAGQLKIKQAELEAL